MPLLAVTADSTTGAGSTAIAPPGVGTLTTVHFALIALLALAALLVILAGIRRARARHDAERRVTIEAEEAGVPAEPEQPGPMTLRDAPLDAQSLDRSTAGFTPSPPTHDDFVAPRPVSPGPTPVEDPPLVSTPPEPVRGEAPPEAPLADEPVAAAARMTASPRTTAEPDPARPVEASPADGPVTQLKGLGPKVAARLAELGITTVGQIAALDADQAQALDARLGPFSGRLHRDRWIEQARFLAAGDRAGFEAVFGRL